MRVAGSAWLDLFFGIRDVGLALDEQLAILEIMDTK